MRVNSHSPQRGRAFHLLAPYLVPWSGVDARPVGGYRLPLNLRDYFEISPKYIAFAAVRLLQKQGKVPEKAVLEFMKKYGIGGEKVEPMTA